MLAHYAHIELIKLFHHACVKHVKLILECMLCLCNFTFTSLFLNYDHNMIPSLLGASSLSLYKWGFLFSSSSAMMLFKNFNHLRISKKIQLDDMFILFSYDFCASYSMNCFIMKSQSKCNKCTHHSCLYVDVLWESLNRTCLLLWKEISKANSELAALSSKVICLQKTLNQANCCALQKADCLAVELDSDNDETENENNSSLSQLIDSMSSFFWNSIFLSQNVKVSSHSS